jgi:hypothetical protein
MQAFWQGLKYGGRVLVKNLNFTAVAVLTIALGAGANTALFSVVNGVLLTSLPYRAAGELVRVWGTAKRAGNLRANISEMDFLDFRAENGARTSRLSTGRVAASRSAVRETRSD